MLALSLTLPLSAGVNDSLAVEPDFKAGEFIMPLTLVGAGTLGFVEPLKNARFEVRDYLDEWRGDHRVTVDDYLHTGIGIEDLVSIGTIGLMKSINTFKANKNIKIWRKLL